jgi:RimK family alpha-L-glutamate ligase
MFLKKYFKKSKKIILINGGTKKFSQDFLIACEKMKIRCIKLKASSSIVKIENNNVEIIQKNQIIDIGKYTNAFIRLKGNSPHMTALISRILHHKSVKINDRVNLSQTLREKRYQIFNDEKITQMISLSQSGLSVPNTVIFSQESFELNKEAIFNLIKFPCVFKSSGAKGKAVWKINSSEEIEKLISESKYELMMVQELLSLDYDIRTLIFEDVYLGAIKRTSGDGFYTNISKGGDAELIELTNKEVELSKKACLATGIDFGGVDFVRTEKGTVFFEVNKTPQIVGFQTATGINIPEKIVQTIDSK